MQDQTETTGVSLSDFMKQVGAVIRASVQEQWVIAEISSISTARGSGHVYIDLVERSNDGAELAKTRGNIWAGRVKAIFDKFENGANAKLAPGIKILLKAAPTFSAQYGFAVEIRDIDPSFTLGDMQRKIAKIFDDLTAAGIIDQNRKLPTPQEFSRVAVISPPEAAGLGDFKSQADILEAAGLCSFDYFHARFQGNQAPDEIVDAMRSALVKNRDLGNHRYYDAIAIIRGGGAVSDLAFLNDFKIANAICRTRIPVMTAIGHERDWVVLDDVANYSAHTPSKLVAFITSTIVNNAQQALRDWQSISSGAAKSIALAGEIIESSIGAIKVGAIAKVETSSGRADINFGAVKSAAMSVLAASEEKNRAAFDAIQTGCAHALSIAQIESQNAFATVVGMGPQRTLERGFAIVRHDGVAVSRKADATHFESLEIQFADGSLSVINNSRESNE